jgi:hypothetical protein
VVLREEVKTDLEDKEMRESMQRKDQRCEAIRSGGDRKFRCKFHYVNSLSLLTVAILLYLFFFPFFSFVLPPTLSLDSLFISNTISNSNPKLLAILSERLSLDREKSSSRDIPISFLLLFQIHRRR